MQLFCLIVLLELCIARDIPVKIIRKDTLDFTMQASTKDYSHNFANHSCKFFEDKEDEEAPDADRVEADMDLAIAFLVKSK